MAANWQLITPQTRLRIAQICFVAHIAANGVMLFALIHGIPPGALETRRAYVAAHPTIWALGWVVWMLAAASLVLMLLAIADTLPQRGWAIFGVILASAGATIDWGVLSVTGLISPQWAQMAVGDPFYANLY